MAIFTNQATLSYNNTVTTSNVTTGNLVDVLDTTKTALGDTYGTGDTITYVVSIRNSGTTESAALTVTDDLGGYPFDTGVVYPLSYVDGSLRYFINGVPQTAAPAVTAGPPLVISGVTVPAGGNVQLIYEARVTGFAPRDSNSGIRNSISIDSPGRAVPLTASADVTVVDEPVLSITKSLSPETVSENGELTYTFVLQNSGNTPADAADNVAVQDTFTPVLNNIAVTYDGVALTEGTDYTYDAASGEFNTVPGRLTVPAAAYTRNSDTGEWITNPGVGTLVVTGTV